MASHNDLGKKGEEAALQHLQAKGHIILQRNFRYGRAEVDIVSQEGNIIVFTEVKTRSSSRFGYPEEFVDRQKVRLMKEAAEEFIYRQHHQGEVRFDIISVTIKNDTVQVHHIEDAFFHE